MNSGGNHGFSLVELLIATTLTLVVSAALLAAVTPAESLLAVQSETIDIQQRLRVATRTLSADLLSAGAGTDAGSEGGALLHHMPPLRPYRQARAGGDPAGSFRTDVLSLTYVPSLRAQTTTASPMPAASGSVRVNLASGCPLTDAACGFVAGAVAIVYDADGSFDLFRVDEVQGSILTLHHTLPDGPMVYAAGSRIAQVVVRAYFLRASARGDGSQLVRDDGDDRPPVPVMDHVVGIGFAYYGDPVPPVFPPPPEPSEPRTAYPPGENCVVMRDGTANAIPRLPVLSTAAGASLVELTARTLTDGPWCPDDTAANRFDADLLRIRQIVVSLRVESANAAFRGPAGPLFVRGGSSTGGNRFVPDRTIRFSVSPRNLAYGTSGGGS